MTRIAVTGGAGFIGTNLVNRLINEGLDVVVIDDLSTGLSSNLLGKKCEFHKISITDLKNVAPRISDCEVIFHLGARGSVPRSIKNPEATHFVNATGTLNVLEIAKKSGAHVIFSSSSSVYGRNSALPKIENMWLGPKTPYAASKLAAESYIQAYADSFGIPTTIFRLFNVFGPFQRPDHDYAAVLPKWIWLAMNDRQIEVFGDGTVSRDFTFIDSVVDIFMSTFKNKVTYLDPINLAYGNKILLNEALSILQYHFPRLKIQYLNPRVGDVQDSQNNPLLIKKLFPEFSPKPFSQSLKETILWLEAFGHKVANGPKVID